MKENYLVKSVVGLSGANTRTTYIYDDFGEPLQGATVLNASKSGVGTASRANGLAVLEANDSDTIQISYIGFTTQSYKASALPNKITMRENIEELEGVTVVAPTRVDKTVNRNNSLNNKENKAKKWIWLAILAVVAGGGYYYQLKK